MKIEFTTAPNNQDIDFLTHKINKETPEFGATHPFAFLIRDEAEEVIAGCNGSVIFGSIYTDQLWVDLNHRGSGLARKLMEAVHKYGRENRCELATVVTMSFQKARGFYEKLGYVVDFERHGYTNRSTCLFLKKQLL